MANEDNCPVEATLELIGGKYKALILWHLSQGILRFSELRQVIKGATPKMLTQQLRELEANGLVHREVYPVIPPKVEYRLTELGLSLSEAFCGVWTWAEQNLQVIEAARQDFDARTGKG